MSCPVQELILGPAVAAGIVSLLQELLHVVAAAVDVRPVQEQFPASAAAVGVVSLVQKLLYAAAVAVVGSLVQELMIVFRAELQGEGEGEGEV